MSKKNLGKNFGTLPLPGKASKKGKKFDKDIVDFINDQIDKPVQEPSSQQPVRLKKLKRAADKEIEEKIVQLKEIEKSESQQQYVASSQSQIQYQKYQNADDQDMKRMEQQEKNKKGKKKARKGEQEIDKFVQKHADELKQSKGKTKKAQPTTQISLQAIFQMASQPKKVQPIYQKKQEDNDSSSSEIDELQLFRRRQFAQNQLKNDNAGLSEKQAIDKAIKQSLKQMNDLKVVQDKTIPVQNYSYDRNKKQSKSILDSKQNKKDQPKKDLKESKPKPNPENRKRQKSQGKKAKEQKTGPFAGLHVVLTGQFDNYSKNKIIELLEKLGAQLPKSITKKATHLLQGSHVVNSFNRRTDQDVKTTTKSVEAAQKGIKIIPYQDLDAFFLQITGNTLDELMQKDKPKKQSNLMDKFLDIHKNSSAAKTVAGKQQISHDNKQNLMIQQNAGKQRMQGINIPWTEKHKPTQCSQIIGQNAQVRDLLEWLRIWEDIHIKGNKRDVKPTFNSFMPSGTINSNAALLSGDAGLGKTTAARLVAKQLGYSIVEYNASDARNKKSVELIKQGKNNLSFMMGPQKQKQMHKTLIIMDEVDGMSSGDRGGITAIIDMIKKTKVPIICICNDRQSTKIRSLAGHCYDIKFHKPNRNMIVKRLEEIIRYEGGTYTNKGLQLIVQMLQNDIRQILTYLQVLFKSGNKNIDAELIQRRCGQTKDSGLMLNFFEASKKLMSRTMFSGMNISQRVDMTFVDSDMVPLMIQQNYLSACAKKKMTSKQFSGIVKATESISMADLVDRTIMKNQNYCLMPNKMFLSCVYPCEMACQNLGFPKFTQWLGKFSSQRKNRRLIKELKNALGTVTNATSYSVKHHFVPMLFQKIYEGLKSSDPQYEMIVHFMMHYGLTPALITQHLTSLQYGEKQNLLKNIEATKKTKLTKTYNKICQDVKFKKDKNKNKVHVEHTKFDPVLGEMEEQNDDDQIQQEENQEQLSQVIVEKKGTKGAKAKKKK